MVVASVVRNPAIFTVIISVAGSSVSGPSGRRLMVCWSGFGVNFYFGPANLTFSVNFDGRSGLLRYNRL